MEFGGLVPATCLVGPSAAEGPTGLCGGYVGYRGGLASEEGQAGCVSPPPLPSHVAQAVVPSLGGRWTVWHWTPNSETHQIPAPHCSPTLPSPSQGKGIQGGPTCPTAADTTPSPDPPRVVPGISGISDRLYSGSFGGLCSIFPYPSLVLCILSAVGRREQCLSL